MKDKDLLLFGESATPDVRTAWNLYQEGLQFNNYVKLDETVSANEDFYVGK